MKRISILLMGFALLSGMSGCMARYQNAVDKSMLIQENLQLDQSLSLAQYRLTIVEDENAALRRELEQVSRGGNGNQRRASTRLRSEANQGANLPNTNNGASSTHEASPSNGGANGGQSVPYKPVPTTLDTTLPQPNPPGRIPPMFLNQRQQNLNRPMTDDLTRENVSQNANQSMSSAQTAQPSQRSAVPPLRAELTRTSPLQMPDDDPITTHPNTLPNTQQSVLPRPGHIESEPLPYSWSPNRPN